MQFAVIVLIFLSSLWGQNPYGRIRGRVTDASGAVVPNATVRALNVESGTEMRATSNAEGNYELPNLIPGRYKLEATLTGFKRFEQAEFEVRVGDVLEMDATLTPGDLSESITVTAEAPLLESGTATLSHVVDGQRILDLPLPGGNPMYLPQLSPGVVQTTTPGNEWVPQGLSAPANLVVAGTSNRNSQFSIDGSPNMSRDGYIAFAPPPEMVQEFRVETAPVDASAGHFSGGSVNMVLRSGTNQLHGNLFFGHQSRPLVTRPFLTNRSIYDTRSGPVTPEKINQLWPYSRMHRYRATMSGPVYIPHVYDGRNRTFWTFGFDWMDRLRNEPRSYTLPTLPERDGDFSALLALGRQYQIYDPYSAQPAPGGRVSRQPLAGNRIPASRIDPIARKLVSFYPQPNAAGTADGRDNYTTPRPRLVDYKSEIARIDHQLSPMHRFFVSLSLYQNYERFNRNFLNEANGLSTDRFHRAVTFDDVLTLGSASMLNFRYNMTRFIRDRGPQAMPFDLAQLGFSQSFTRQLNASRMAFPNIAVDGGAFAPLGDETLLTERNTHHVFGATFSHLRGGHSLRVGSEFRLFQVNDGSLGNVSPSLTFNSAWTRGELDTAAPAPLGQGLASLLFGLPASGFIDKRDTFATTSRYLSLFVQDDWKATPALTVNVGLRWEAEFPATERYNRMNRGFDFDAASPVEAAARAAYARSAIPEIAAADFRVKGGLLFAGPSNRSLRAFDGNNFSPRIGLAWRLRQNTVIRASYGIFFDVINETPADILQQGYSETTQVVPTLDNGLTFRGSLADPFVDGIRMPGGVSGGLSTFLGRAITFVNPNQTPAYMQRWSFNIQRQLPWRLLTQIGYLGNRGTGLGVTEAQNAIPAQYLSRSPERDQARINSLQAQVTNPFYGMPEFTGTTLQGRTVARSQLLMPYPQFAGITTTSNGGFSWYHALLASVEKRMAKGFTFQGAYTWSRTMEAVDRLNPTDPSLHHVVSNFDRPHRLTGSAIYELPFARRSKGVLAQVVGGWSIQGMYTYQTGPALQWGNILFRGDIHDIPLPSSERTVERWFNTDAGFERSNALALASNIRTFPLRLSGVRGIGFNNVDLSLYKTFRIMERLRLQLRGEATNAFNRANFNVPNTAPANTLFGQINQGDPEQRRITLALRLSW